MLFVCKHLVPLSQLPSSLATWIAWWGPMRWRHGRCTTTVYHQVLRLPVVHEKISILLLVSLASPMCTITGIDACCSVDSKLEPERAQIVRKVAHTLISIDATACLGRAVVVLLQTCFEIWATCDAGSARAWARKSSPLCVIWSKAYPFVEAFPSMSCNW